MILLGKGCVVSIYCVTTWIPKALRLYFVILYPFKLSVRQYLSSHETSKLYDVLDIWQRCETDIELYIFPTGFCDMWHQLI